jgi:capsular polysaccharide biosynthesis protein
MKNDRLEFRQYLDLMWRKKWQIFIPALFCALAAGLVSFLVPKIWEVDAIIQPGRFSVQTTEGGFTEVLVVNPREIVGQINERAYNTQVAAELNLERINFPRVRAQQLTETNLVRFWIREKDVVKARSILSAIFARIKENLDKKTFVEIKGINTQIAKNNNAIELKKLTTKDRENQIKIKNNEITAKKLDIQSNKIHQAKIGQEIQTTLNKKAISEERVQSILEELGAVKTRIDELEQHQKKALETKMEGAEAISLLLYSSEVQQNFRYYNTLEEKLSIEKITQENLTLQEKEKREELKEIDTQIERLNTDIITLRTLIDEIKNSMEKIQVEITNINQDNELLTERKARIDYTRLVKQPTVSIFPVAPKISANIIFAFFLGLIIFAFICLFAVYMKGDGAVFNGRRFKNASGSGDGPVSQDKTAC